MRNASGLTSCTRSTTAPIARCSRSTTATPRIALRASHACTSPPRSRTSAAQSPSPSATSRACWACAARCPGPVSRSPPRAGFGRTPAGLAAECVGWRWGARLLGVLRRGAHRCLVLGVLGRAARRRRRAEAQREGERLDREEQGRPDVAARAPRGVTSRGGRGEVRWSERYAGERKERWRYVCVCVCVCV